MGWVLVAPGILLYVVCGFWGLVICFGIVKGALGTFWALVSLFFFPFLLGLAPWYEGLANGDWFPLVLVYGGGILASILITVGGGMNGRQ